MRFAVYFPGADFDALWANLAPNGIQKGRFGDHFDAIWEAGPTCGN